MPRRRKKHRKPLLIVGGSQTNTTEQLVLPKQYEKARQLSEQGQHDQAHGLYTEVAKSASNPKVQALVRNDLSALAALRGEIAAAREGFQGALSIDHDCELARANLALLEAEFPIFQVKAEPAQPNIIGNKDDDKPNACKVALVSFLFNWPSTGGGIVHTIELAKFLAKAGYEVRHFFARHLPWGVGNLEDRLPFPSEALDFDVSTWTVKDIKSRFYQAVKAFDPDHVIITDSWNMKPILAEALRDYPYILRFQAMECLCPLNNVRFLPEGNGRFHQCSRHQLATPELCASCIGERGHQSGSLHQTERALSGVGTAEYHHLLIRGLREAEAVLVVNPLMEAMISPYSQCVRVVTAGMDPARFPWPWPDEPGKSAQAGLMQIFFAGLVEEWIKGFRVLHEAGALLWQHRQDFELIATGHPPGPIDAFTRYVGWLSQEELPRHLRASDICVIPTIAQEALGRTAVEAMAVGRPVIASRLGGLPFTVCEGATGLLCEPGDAQDLAAKLETLIDNPGLRSRLGLAGRRRFEEHYSWDVIIERHYRPLLGPSVKNLPALTCPSVPGPREAPSSPPFGEAGIPDGPRPLSPNDKGERGSP
jgi:glycosyltransferase involved in cell wall biosynthesis